MMNMMRWAVGGFSLKASVSLPASIWMITPPMPPAMVPMPMTEATVFVGNMSETVVKGSRTTPDVRRDHPDAGGQTYGCLQGNPADRLSHHVHHLRLELSDSVEPYENAGAQAQTDHRSEE